jgi:DUSP domain
MDRSGSGSAPLSCCTTHLSYILPVTDACEILGEPVVHRIVGAFGRLLRTEAATIEADVAALFFRASGDTPIPPLIRQAWQHFTTATLSVHANLVPFLVPYHVQPAQTGSHRGLFDCWKYTLQGHAVTNTTTEVVLLPDVLILLAVAQQYRDLLEHQDDNQEDVIQCMARAAFRFYNAYQKKGTVARDTVQRFLTDVLDTSAEAVATEHADLLNQVFAPTTAAAANGSTSSTPTSSSLAVALSESLFIQRISETWNNGHGLLDWMATFLVRMIPAPAESAVDTSTRPHLPAFLTSYLQRLAWTPKPLSQTYRLAEWFEVKRRFHSLAITAIMAASDDGMQSGSVTGSKKSTSAVVTWAAWQQAVARNDEMGTGGYLPTRLARLVFLQGLQQSQQQRRGDDEEDSTDDDEPPLEPRGWTLYHVLAFGCRAVRQEQQQDQSPLHPDVPLLRFVFEMFRRDRDDDEKNESPPPLQGKANPLKEAATTDESPPPLVSEDVEEPDVATHVEAVTAEDSSETDIEPVTADSGEEHDDDDNPHRRVLSRVQVGRMIRGLLEHAAFRLEADVAKEETPAAEIDQVKLAALLNLLPLKFDNSRMDLDVLVDFALQDKECMTFADFVAWHQSGSRQPGDREGPQRPVFRLGPLMMDLRMIAAVLLGIPPTLASMELALIDEIVRRHKLRYPPTDASKRGPRGTVWYLMDCAWLKNWTSHVEQVSGTERDAQDQRDQATTELAPRGVQRIRNRALLEDNGLSLRRDLKWRRDYEIVPPLAWSALQAWYDGGPPISRTVVPYVPATTAHASPHVAAAPPRIDHELELYPLFVNVFLCDVRGESRPFQQYVPLSYVLPVRMMLIQLCKGLGADPDKTRLWMMAATIAASPVPTATGSNALPEHGQDWIIDLDQNISDQMKRRGRSSENDSVINLLLEIKDAETGQWPRSPDYQARTDAPKETVEEAKSELGDGIVGLYNMG